MACEEQFDACYEPLEEEPNLIGLNLSAKAYKRELRERLFDRNSLTKLLNDIKTIKIELTDRENGQDCTEELEALLGKIDELPSAVDYVELENLPRHTVGVNIRFLKEKHSYLLKIDFYSKRSPLKRIIDYFIQED